MDRHKYYNGMTGEQIRADVADKQAEIKRADKRTYNGKITKIFNTAIIQAGEQKLKELEGNSI